MKVCDDGIGIAKGKKKMDAAALLYF